VGAMGEPFDKLHYEIHSEKSIAEIKIYQSPPEKKNLVNNIQQEEKKEYKYYCGINRD